MTEKKERSTKREQAGPYWHLAEGRNGEKQGRVLQARPQSKEGSETASLRLHGDTQYIGVRKHRNGRAPLSWEHEQQCQTYPPDPLADDDARAERVW